MILTMKEIQRKHSSETKLKISNSQKGIAKSYEHRQKISNSLKGNQNRCKQLKLF